MEQIHLNSNPPPKKKKKKKNGVALDIPKHKYLHPYMTLGGDFAP